jgi:uncharacterized protein (TIGR00369 family)
MTPGSLEALRERLNALPVCGALWLRCVHAEPELAEVEMAVPSELRHPDGVIPGPFLLALADVAGSFALHTAIPYDDLHITIDLTAHFVRPISTRLAHGRGHVLRVGADVAFATVEVDDDNGRRCLVASGSWVIKRNSLRAPLRGLQAEIKQPLA